MNNLTDKIFGNKRISVEEGIELFNNISINELAILADNIRRKKHPQNIVTYIVDRNINYTNICESKCLFCAFHADNPGQNGYVLSKKEIGTKIQETIDAGGVQILLQGGMNPDLSLDYYEELFRFIKSNYKIHIHALSPPEIIYLASKSEFSVKDTLSRLISAGLDSVPGGGAEILSDNIRKKVSPNKYSSKQWLTVMEKAHELGLKTTATMMFGMGEHIEDRMEHLLRVRELQDNTGGFTAFIPWTFQPFNKELKAENSTAFTYLKMLALSRIFLDNIENIQVSWVTQGSGIAQMGLHFGANDFGSTMMEENVVKAAGVSFRMKEKEIRKHIINAGFIPKKRNMKYTVIE